ncbi:MAG: glycoside hydrolase family 130 protein [Victivallales bacterium]|nr:glycoside hydrolase family 130 protein [Victivallales bacterium]
MSILQASTISDHAANAASHGLRRIYPAVKHPANPILSSANFPIAVHYVFNPGAIKFGDEYIMIVDAALGTTSIVFWLARSRDGVNFVPDPDPLDWPENPTYPACCVYDPRITKFGDEYVIMHASHSRSYSGPRVSVVKTRDFKKFTRIEQEMTPHANRNAVLFPEKIGGRYVRFDRPMETECGKADMCVSFSDDLSHWYDTTVLMQPRSGWDSHKIGGAAVPIRTEQGWLAIYHGVDNSSCNNYIYRLGVVLLDLEDPTRIISRGEMPLLWPEHDYEFFGRTPNVVFCCNTIVEPDRTVKIYYGAADTCIGLATAKLDDLIELAYSKADYADKFFKRVPKRS